ncbi:MAG TPA: biotin--[acetyl-CoA-carboxylase] ligase [Candidatus Competibacteraceae bacterium]|nr:biotin--[acetyl-CoA-carboxylase] ligase [Candidatus Competibacteraceae bacterium]
MKVALELLDRDCILAGLTDTARAALNRLEVYPVLDSTNCYLMAGAQAEWPSGIVCLAEQQTSGRGRQGRSWLTPFGASLACSLLWRFAAHPTALSGLSLATGIAIARVLERSRVTGVGLKWPNDVWWRGRKLGGILLESGGASGNFYVVAGVGVNIALPRQEAAIIDQPWVDLQEILAGEPISRNVLAAALISELIETFIRFEQGGFADLAADWVRFDQVKGHQVSLHLPDTTVTGVARGVDATGALLLETANGEVKPYIGGEISLRLDP